MSEKVVFENSNGLKLVGDYYSSDSGKCVIMCHGFCANKNRVRTIKAAESYNNIGLGVLRFNFGGSEGSYDSEITVENQVIDLNGAIEFMTDSGYKEVFLQGESMGGLVVLKSYPNYKKLVRGMILWAPVTKGKDLMEDVAEQIKLKTEDLGKKGFVVKHKDDKDFVIPMKYFEERLNVDQRDLLGNVICPVLILHGDNDDTVPLEDSKGAIKIFDNGKLAIINGSGHKFEGFENELIRISSDWLGSICN
tara:strand:- start:2959 stop:3708 length:750 start_codon:yes stop_codon:yes gene_type:complete